MTGLGQWHANRPDLLVAAVAWETLVPALRQTSGETLELLGPPPPGNWSAWQYSGMQGDAWPLLAACSPPGCNRARLHV